MNYILITRELSGQNAAQPCMHPTRLLPRPTAGFRVLPASLAREGVFGTRRAGDADQLAAIVLF